MPFEVLMKPDMNPSQQIFAGVDGGGTQCRVRLRDAAGGLIGEAMGGSGNIRLGLDLVWSHILAALEAALAQSGRDRSAFPTLAIGLGLAGISDAGDAQRTLAAGPKFARACASSDAHTACLGAFSGDEGGILISGTGSCAYAWVGGAGRQVGGWGFELCDDGSAADLGRSALRAALDAHDGLIAPSPLTEAMMARFGAPADIVHFVTGARPKDYGALAPLVMDHANTGDPVAVGLVEHQAADIGRYAARLHALGAKRICLVGGMARVFEPWLSSWVRSVLVAPQHDALEGAILMAQGAPNGLIPTEQVTA